MTERCRYVPILSHHPKGLCTSASAAPRFSEPVHRRRKVLLSEKRSAMSEIALSNLIRQLSASGTKVTRPINHLKRSPELLNALVTALSSDSAELRLCAAKALRGVSRHAPDLLSPHFDVFVSLLHHRNSILRWNAILIVGNLAAVLPDPAICAILDDYLAPIAGPHMIDAANIMVGAASIASAKPGLADPIANRILAVESAVYDTPECLQVAIGHAIKAFRRIFPIVSCKSEIQMFVLRQLRNTRPATRKKAEDFLRKWPLQKSAS